MDGCNLQSPGQKSIYSYSREWERSHNGLWIMDARGWHFLRQYTTGNRDLPMGHGQTQTVLYLKSTAPALWSNIAMRVPTEHNKSGDLYHAEDTAMFFLRGAAQGCSPWRALWTKGNHDIVRTVLCRRRSAISTTLQQFKQRKYHPSHL